MCGCFQQTDGFFIAERGGHLLGEYQNLKIDAIIVTSHHLDGTATLSRMALSVGAGPHACPSVG